MRNLSIALLFIPLASMAKQWTVSPLGTYKTPQAVSSLVAAGDTVLIEAALYSNLPQITFTKDNLLIKGTKGRPRLEAGSLLANNTNGKAIFVISGKNCTIENLEFANAAVPDHNGAGIRQEACDLVVRHCYFNGNEMGILGGNYSPCKVTMEYNIFANNGSPANPGYQHNIYINHIDTFIFRFNYSINAIAEGHELKSRAHNNFILYNYIGNLNSLDSRNIDLPNGGTALIMGNIIEQNQASANSNILGFGMEGLTNPAPHNIWLVNNSFINKKSTGSFVQLGSGTDTFFLKNNIMVGAKTGGLILGSARFFDSSNNFVNNQIAAAGFIDATHFDYHLTKNSTCVDKGIAIKRTVRGYALTPVFEYDDTASAKKRHMGPNVDIGAFEYANLGSKGSTEKASLEFWPNPAGEALYVPNFKNKQYTITSETGSYILGGIVTEEAIAISNLVPGIYFLKIDQFTARFLKR